MLIIVATVAITIWWIQRPIKPVVLTPKEKQTVQAKLDRLSATGRSSPGTPSATTVQPTDVISRPPENRYTPGAAEVRLTEREINGLLNQNTDLGKSLRIEFDRDAINAYLAVPIPKDFPVGGGKTFRARGRFALSIDKQDKPYAILEDVSVFGVSLPKDWLGGVKGENLLAEAVGEHKGGPVLRGIKSLHVVPGELVLQLEK